MEKNPRSKYSYFGLVIEPEKESTNPDQELAHFQDLLLLVKSRLVATIIHDKDTENNEPKRIHLHAYISYAEKHTEKQVLSDISSLLDINPIRVSVRGSNNEFLLAQYLIHKNDKEKYQYSIEEIKSNNKEFILGLVSESAPTKPKNEDEDLQLSLKQCKSILELMDTIGLQQANRYRPIFNQIKQEQGTDIKSLYEQLNKYATFTKQIERLLTYEVFTDDIDRKSQLYKALYQLFKYTFGEPNYDE